MIEINVNGQFSRGEGNVIVIFFHYAGVSIDCKIVHSSPKQNALISHTDVSVWPLNFALISLFVCGKVGMHDIERDAKAGSTNGRESDRRTESMRVVTVTMKVRTEGIMYINQLEPQ
jgi:hypothetical protein